MPRVRDLPGWKAYPRPHFNPTWESHTIVCYCKKCDEKVDRELPLSLEEFCNCDQYIRWICLPCREKENREDKEYYLTRTKLVNENNYFSNEDEGRWIGDHSSVRAVSTLFLYLKLTKSEPKSGFKSRSSYRCSLEFIVLVSLWYRGSQGWQCSVCLVQEKTQSRDLEGRRSCGNSIF